MLPPATLPVRSHAWSSPIGLAILLALLAGCDRKPHGGPPAMPPPQVSVITVQPQPVARTTELPGRTTPVLTSDVRPQVNGVILKRLFVEGSEVTEGQQLYLIDPATYQATYDSALATLAHDEAALVSANAKAKRYKPLAAAEAVSTQDYDDAVAAAKEAQANIATAKANIEQAKINLNYTKVSAPIAGHIGRSTVTPGALVTANQTTALATVTQLDPIYVDLNQSATTLLRLKQELASGQIKSAGNGATQVSLKLDDGSTYAHPGKLQFSEVTVDQSTGTVLLRAVFPNPDHLLLPGMYVHAELSEGVDNNSFLLPQEAVSRNTRGDPTVLTVGAGDKAQLQIIQTGQAIGNKWVVTGGIKAGDRVIVDNLQNVRPGAPVHPVDAPPQAATEKTAANKS
jgi:membrane fusion protein (multidrug efflux system)